MRETHKVENTALNKLRAMDVVCNGCKSQIAKGQYVYVVGENFYHDCCSSKIKGRRRIL